MSPDSCHSKSYKNGQLTFVHEALLGQTIEQLDDSQMNEPPVHDEADWHANLQPVPSHVMFIPRQV
jgi:hypothetical protein